MRPSRVGCDRRRPTLAAEPPGWAVLQPSDSSQRVSVICRTHKVLLQAGVKQTQPQTVSIADTVYYFLRLGTAGNVA